MHIGLSKLKKVNKLTPNNLVNNRWENSINNLNLLRISKIMLELVII